MAPLEAEPRPSSVKQRVISALVLGPVALVGAYLGRPYFEIVAAMFAVAMAWEWARLCHDQGRFVFEGWIGLGAVLAMIGAAIADRYDVAAYLGAAGAVAVYAAGAISGHRTPALAAVGPVVVGATALSVIWLRDLPEVGLATLLWLLGTVWTTDIAAYFVGRRIGGPRLAPRISPKKTWSGLVGAVLCAALWSLVWGQVPGTPDAWLLAVLGAAVAVIAQVGDLAISVLKRYFGAKDASNLIPGHGGVLDRVDGFVTAAPVVACFVWFTRGMVWPLL